jgi:hypothetical protein
VPLLSRIPRVLIPCSCVSACPDVVDNVLKACSKDAVCAQLDTHDPPFLDRKFCQLSRRRLDRQRKRSMRGLHVFWKGSVVFNNLPGGGFIQRVHVIYNFHPLPQTMTSWYALLPEAPLNQERSPRSLGSVIVLLTSSMAACATHSCHSAFPSQSNALSVAPCLRSFQRPLKHEACMLLQ